MFNHLRPYQTESNYLKNSFYPYLPYHLPCKKPLKKDRNPFNRPLKRIGPPKKGLKRSLVIWICKGDQGCQKDLWVLNNLARRVLNQKGFLSILLKGCLRESIGNYRKQYRGI